MEPKVSLLSLVEIPWAVNIGGLISHLHWSQMQGVTSKLTTDSIGWFPLTTKVRGKRTQRLLSAIQLIDHSNVPWAVDIILLSRVSPRPKNYFKGSSRVKRLRKAIEVWYVTLYHPCFVFFLAELHQYIELFLGSSCVSWKVLFYKGTGVVFVVSISKWATNVLLPVGYNYPYFTTSKWQETHASKRGGMSPVWRWDSLCPPDGPPGGKCRR